MFEVDPDHQQAGVGSGSARGHREGGLAGAASAEDLGHAATRVSADACGVVDGGEPRRDDADVLADDGSCFRHRREQEWRPGRRQSTAVRPVR